jgi:hypothetical protein
VKAAGGSGVLPHLISRIIIPNMRGDCWALAGRDGCPLVRLPLGHKLLGPVCLVSLGRPPSASFQLANP